MAPIYRGLLLCLALLAGIVPARAEDAPMQIAGATTVGAEQVIALANDKPDLVILDNRHAEDYAAGAIEGAKRLLDTDVDAGSLARMVPAKTTPVLFYCNGLRCGRAARAAERAVGLGYTQVFYYALGMTEWEALNLPVAKGK